MVNPPDHPVESPTRVALLLLPPCSALGIGTVVDPLEMANRHAGRKLYEISYHSHDGKPVALSGGVRFPVQGALGMPPECDLLIVIAEGIVPFPGHPQALHVLARLAGRSLVLGGVHAAPYWLARAGLLEGYRATLHWMEIPRFSHEFEGIVVSHNLYEIDRDRFTSSGGAANLDLMLALVARQQGREVAAALSEQLCLQRMRAADERQRIPLSARLGGRQPKLTEAIELMEANIDEPLSTDEIARCVDLSRRQLERLFKQFLNALPSRYYLDLRLNRARHLLQHTGDSIVRIGQACGFSSAPHFSTVYRAHFGVTPREQRMRCNRDEFALRADVPVCAESSI